MPLALVVSAALAAGGCQDTQPITGARADSGSLDAGRTLPEPLVEATAWQRYPAKLDPMASHQPSMLDCGVAGFYVERGELEVDTGYCNYVLAQAPALLHVSKGTLVSLELRHFDLAAPQPASAHVAIFFDQDLQWETEIAIPHAADVLHVRWPATRTLQQGEPVRLHLHNHGQNNWAIGYLRIEHDN